MAATAATQISSLHLDTIPAVSDPGEEESPWAPLDEATRPRVLVVEDDGAMRRLLTDALQKHGYEVIQAANGAEAVDLVLQPWACGGLLEPSFDVIITDIRMSGFSGLELLRLVCNSTITTPVIVITAFGAPDVHATAARLGAVAVFDKPFDLDRLTRAVHTIVDS